MSLARCKRRAEISSNRAAWRRRSCALLVLHPIVHRVRGLLVLIVKADAARASPELLPGERGDALATARAARGVGGGPAYKCWLVDFRRE